MLLRIIESTPLHIWALLAGLVALGVSQARQRTIGAGRALLLPAALVVLSLAGVVSAFGVSAVAVAAWATCVAVALGVGIGGRALPRLQATWSAARDRVHVSGSWLPLALILGLFAVKYAAGASLALHPTLARDTAFVSACGLAYGVFSGLFAARGWQLWHARQAQRA